MSATAALHGPDHCAAGSLTTHSLPLGLGALLELAEFQTALTDGFDRLTVTGSLHLVGDEGMDLSGFPTRRPVGPAC